MEEAAKEVEKAWQDKTRAESRERLHRRHETNYMLEVKSGVTKPMYKNASMQSESSGRMILGFVEEKRYKNSKAMKRLAKPKDVIFLKCIFYEKRRQDQQRIVCMNIAISVDYSMWIIRMR